MKENFDEALQAVLQHEGGFVNHPSDPGGMTNLGCTRKVWEAWVGHPVDEQTMRNLKPAEVAPLYRARYWDKVRGDDLPAGVDYAAFDAAINSGPARAAKWLQETVGVTADGLIGPMTLKSVAARDPAHIVKDYNDRRLEFLRTLPTWSDFGKGWGRRVTEVASVSGRMASASVLRDHLA